MIQDQKKQELSTFFLVGSLCFGIFLRIYDLNLLGPWSDELATLWYAKHPGDIFFDETHPPLFYLFNSVSHLFKNPLAVSRLLSAFFSLGLILLSFRLALRTLGKREATLLAVLLLLSYTDIVHARMARQYSLLGNASVLLLLLSTQGGLRISQLLVSFFLCWIHPCGFLTPLSLAAYGFLKRSYRESLPFLVPVLSITFYYGVKFFLLGKAHSLHNYFKGAERSDPFLLDLFYTLAGDHYPKFNAIALDSIAMAITALFLILFVGGAAIHVYRHGKFGPLVVKILLLIIMSLLFAEFFSFLFFDIKRGRYYIFLLPAVFLGLSIFWSSIRWSAGIAYILQLTSLLVMNPLAYYPGEREAFENYKKVKINHPEVELILCGNKYQFDYYLKAPREDCLERFKKLSQVKKRFFIVELNGSSWKIYHEASKTFQVGDLRMYGISSSAVAVAKRTHP